MIYWKHSFNFAIFSIIAIFLYMITKYFNLTEKFLTKQEKKNKDILLVITWILFALSCVGGIGALLEMIGVLHKEYKINLI